MKTVILSGIVAFAVSFSVMKYASNEQFEPQKNPINPVQVRNISLEENAHSTDLSPNGFTEVSDKVMDAVVHIKSTQISQMPASNYRALPDPFRNFFHDDLFDHFFQPGYPYRQQQTQPQTKTSTGSGVIINDNGYIVTNNHVIKGADEIDVVLHDNREFKAEVIGVDPSTDLALLRIDEQELTSIPLVNSDDVKVGEWVLAVGNPFNLNSTVTAGIVSAKSRNINILKDKYAIESFIQTDAAINPGNSGGALVNLEGGLVGINTAIASPTGSYAGYGFAIPSNIVNKVVEDLLNYGEVQRGYLGVSIRGVDAELAEELDMDLTKGVYIDSVNENSAALAAGLKKGDVILEVADVKVGSTSELQEIIGRYHPGDEVNILVNRNGKKKEFTVELHNSEGEAKISVSDKNEIFSTLGAEFEALDRKKCKDLNLKGGVMINKIEKGKLLQETSIREGFIITHIDRKAISSVQDLTRALQNKDGGILIQGFYENEGSGVTRYYAFGW